MPNLRQAWRSGYAKRGIFSSANRGHPGQTPGPSRPEEDILCDWQPNQIERRVVSRRLDYTVVGGSDKWMGTSKHQYLHWLRCQLPLGRHDLTDLKLDTLRSSLSEIGWLRRCGLPLGSALKQSWTDVNGARPLPCWYLPSTFQMMHF